MHFTADWPNSYDFPRSSSIRLETQKQQINTKIYRIYKAIITSIIVQITTDINHKITSLQYNTR